MSATESPRWLLKKGRYLDAFNSLKRLRHHELQAARDLYAIHIGIEGDKNLAISSSYLTRFTELFTIPRVRRATVASGTVMLAQQVRFLCFPPQNSKLMFYRFRLFLDVWYKHYW